MGEKDFAITVGGKLVGDDLNLHVGIDQEDPAVKPSGDQLKFFLKWSDLGSDYKKAPADPFKDLTTIHPGTCPCYIPRYIRIDDHISFDTVTKSVIIYFE